MIIIPIPAPPSSSTIIIIHRYHHHSSVTERGITRISGNRGIFCGLSLSLPLFFSSVLQAESEAHAP
jgi:hypothetical protein